MKKIAIVGSGISGLSAAWLLSQKYDVTLFEKESKCGGHSLTIDVEVDNKKFSFDVGFMVFNPAQYPNLTKLFKYLGVATKKTNMSFSVSVGEGDVEFSGSFPRGLFADTRNIFRPRFILFLFEILRFNSIARKALKKDTVGEVTVGSFLEKHNFSTFFRRHYIYPMAGSIWSGSFGDVAEFPALVMFEFLDRHHLLEVGNKPLWETPSGGSRVYVQKMVEDIKKNNGKILTETPITNIERNNDEITVKFLQESMTFDAVVVATHADSAIKMIGDLTEEEKEVLNKFEYSTNRVVAHSDPSNMPQRKAAWSSWNFCCPPTGKAEHIYLTYRMNSIQHIDPKYPMFVTLNPLKDIDPDKLHADFSLAHPKFNLETKKAQKELPSLQGVKNTYYCGAYFGYGFHEDGLVSGINVAKLFEVEPPWK